MGDEDDDDSSIVISYHVRKKNHIYKDYSQRNNLLLNADDDDDDDGMFRCLKKCLCVCLVHSYTNTKETKIKQKLVSALLISNTFDFEKKPPKMVIIIITDGNVEFKIGFSVFELKTHRAAAEEDVKWNDNESFLTQKKQQQWEWMIKHYT